MLNNLTRLQSVTGSHFKQPYDPHSVVHKVLTLNTRPMAPPLNINILPVKLIDFIYAIAKIFILVVFMKVFGIRGKKKNSKEPKLHLFVYVTVKTKKQH